MNRRGFFGLALLPLAGLFGGARAAAPAGEVLWFVRCRGADGARGPLTRFVRAREAADFYRRWCDCLQQRRLPGTVELLFSLDPNGELGNLPSLAAWQTLRETGADVIRLAQYTYHAEAA